MTQGQVNRVHHGGTTDDELIDFSANTNPVVPDGVREQYESGFELARRYPDDTYTTFRKHASNAVSCDHELVVPTAGGLEALRLAVQSTVDQGDRVAIPAPSFSEYHREVRLQGGDPICVHSQKILDINPSKYTAVIICNPNNPTGYLYSRSHLETLIQKCRQANTAVIIDEAFLDFTNQSSLAGTPGAIVLRSLTKMYGLPGIRAGYAVASAEYQEKINSIRRTWNLSTPALLTGTYCLQQQSFVSETKDRVQEERIRIWNELASDFTVIPSDAPFLLIDTGQQSVDKICKTAKSAGIKLRDARTFHGLDNHVRIAVRMPEENDDLIEVLSNV